MTNKEMEKPCPILKSAISEIQDILKKHDIGGHVMLASKNHAEYLLHFPTWSKAQLEISNTSPSGIRFKAKGEDEDGTIASSVHVLQVFMEISGSLFVNLDKIMTLLRQKMKIDGGPVRLHNDHKEK